MRLPRFTIAGLMGLVVVVAVGVAALRFASETWAGVLLMLTLGVLGAAVLALHERAGVSRAWWRGFALFGWGYVVLALGPWASEAIAPHLPTTIGLDALNAKLHPGGPVQELSLDYSSPISSTVTTPPSTGSSTIVVDPRMGSSTIALDTARAANTSATTLYSRLVAANSTPEFFRRVGHCLWALLEACVGGLVGRACHATGSTGGTPGDPPR
jgi:hypothetical protein